MTQNSPKATANNRIDSTPSFVEHHVPRKEGRVYAREYKGAGPAFVLMHDFPDNLHIWNDLLPYLITSGRRVVTWALAPRTNPPALHTASGNSWAILKRSSRVWV